MTATAPANTFSLSPTVNGRTISYDHQVSGPWREAFHIDKINGWFAAVGNGIHRFCRRVRRKRRGRTARHR